MARRVERIAPWRSGDGWTLVHGNCVEVMARFPARSVDVIFADPPYFLSTERGTTVKSGRRVAVAKGTWDAELGVEDELAFHLRWLEQARAVLRRDGTIWITATHHTLFQVGHAMRLQGWHVLNLLTWFKPNATPNVACRSFTHSAEHLIWASPEEREPLPHFFDYAWCKAMNGGKQLRDVWTIPTTPMREKKHGSHPTMKPLALVERALRASTRPDALVLDPFCGSGTTLVAARKLGRRAIGIDLDESFLELTARRLAA